MTRRTWIGLAAVAFVLAIAVWSLREMSAFSDTERRIADYCRSLPTGQALTQARERALQARLVARDVAATQWHPPILTIESSHAWLKGSACRIRHNGTSVTQASYDPWYQ
ncbi:MAG: hypothetical protein VX871_06505 [Pseudomonadota bacterium]|nr:hypothetical protein [Pseudomonadota bacterium]